jgi:5-methyltetrahydropteroyltriglutamate--homocysteine methyltransferase
MKVPDSPPFRADHVGSLLRPAALKEARAKRTAGDMPEAAFREIEDGEIARLIAMQEEVGLRVATDGECRRVVWNIDFFEHLDGFEGYIADHGVQFKGTQAPPKAARLVGKIGFSGHPMLEHFAFLKEHTRVTPKMTIPSPAIAHFRGNRDEMRSVYPDRDEYFADFAEAYSKALKAFYEAGCRYLQLDDTTWAHLCDPEQRELARSLGDDPDELPGIYARTINAILGGRPAGMTVTTHICRGNFRSTWVSQGGYEPVAEVLFAGIVYDGYFLEYDSDRAGGFEPLRFLPKEGDSKVVLGLVTSKFGALEDKDAVKRRIDEASRFVALDRLCLSPQCGFASTEEGNIIAESEQWDKLRLCVEIAEEVWGTA